MPPVIGRNRAGVDAGLFHRVDMAEHLLHFWPACNPQQDFGAGTDERHRLARFSRCHGAQDVDARRDRAEIVGRPANEGKDAAGPEGEDTTASVEDLFLSFMAEPDPVLDALVDVGQLDMGQCVAGKRQGVAPRRGRCGAGHGPSPGMGEELCIFGLQVLSAAPAPRLVSGRPNIKKLDSKLDSKLGARFRVSGQRLNWGSCA